MSAITFTVPGRPAPQGSKTFKGYRGGHPILIEASKEIGAWRERIAIAAHNAMNGQQLLTGPIHLTAHFVIPRPKATPKTKPTPPATGQPDLDKLIRSIGDAITGSCIHTDAQITGIVATKRRAELDEPFGVTVTIRRNIEAR